MFSQAVAGVSLPKDGPHRARRLVKGETAMLTDAANLDLVYQGFQKLYPDVFLAAPAHSDKIAMKVASSGASERYS